MFNSILTSAQGVASIVNLQWVQRTVHTVDKRFDSMFCSPSYVNRSTNLSLLLETLNIIRPSGFPFHGKSAV